MLMWKRNEMLKRDVMNEEQDRHNLMVHTSYVEAIQFCSTESSLRNLGRTWSTECGLPYPQYLNQPRCLVSGVPPRFPTLGYRYPLELAAFRGKFAFNANLD